MFQKSAKFLCGYTLTGVMILLKEGHQNNLGTTNAGYKFKMLKPMRFEREPAIYTEIHNQRNYLFNLE